MSAVQRAKMVARRVLAPLIEKRLPEGLRNVETMLSREELLILHDLAGKRWNGSGLIVDAGCFLGGSTIALGEGLKTNKAWQANRVQPVIHSYDLFQIEAYTLGTFFNTSSELGSSFEERYRQNIANVNNLVDVHAGDITATPWTGEPVEILFIDLAKHWTVNDFMVEQFFPCLIPGHSVVVQQDYIYDDWNGWLAVTMEYFSDYFVMEKHAKYGSVVFKLEKPIPPSMLEKPVFQSLTVEQITELMDRAHSNFSGVQREILQKSRANLLALLKDQNWPTATSS